MRIQKRLRTGGLLAAFGIAAGVMFVAMNDNPSTAGSTAEAPVLEDEAEVAESRRMRPAALGGQSPDVNAVAREPHEDALRADDVEAALSSTDPAVRAHAIAQLFPRLARQDPATAARLAESAVDVSQRDLLLRAVAISWAEKDRLEAIAWAQGLHEPEDRDIALSQVFRRIAMADPADAVRLRQHLVQTGEFDVELIDLAQRWAEVDLADTLEWTDSLPPGDQRNAVVARAAFVQAQQSPAEAARLVMSQLDKIESQSEALISVVHQWAQRDPLAASAWVEQLPAGPVRERAVAEIASIERSTRNVSGVH